MVAVPQVGPRLGPGDQRREGCLALGQRAGAQVEPVEEEQIEHEVHQPRVVPGRQGLLQLSEAAAAVGLESDDLAVDPGLGCGEPGDGTGYRRETGSSSRARAA